MTLLSANWYNIFYWLTVSDGVKKFFDGSSNLFTTISVIAFILLVITSIGKAYCVSDNRIETKEEELKDADVRGWELLRKYTLRIFWPMFGVAVICWIGYVAVPSKKDCMLIVAGGAVGNFIGADSSVKSIPADVTRYLHLGLQEKISDLSSEAKKEIGLQTPAEVKKETFLDKVKSLSKDEIIEAFKNDTTLAK